MELIAYILFLLANNWITALVLSLVAVIGGFGWFAFAWAGLKTDNAEGYPATFSGRLRRRLLSLAVIAAFFVAIATFVFSIVNMVFPHLVDGYLITAIGKTADARVTSVDPTSNYLNKSRVMRHNVLFKTESGSNYETYFETWDFNVFPSANTVTYPGQGAAFRVAYLPSFPSAFLILENAESEFTHSRECSEAGKAFDEARVKIEFDPDDQAFVKEFLAATEKLRALKCPGYSVEIDAETGNSAPAMKR